MCKVRVEEGEFERGRCSVAVLPNEERERGLSLHVRHTRKVT